MRQTQLLVKSLVTIPALITTAMLLVVDLCFAESASVISLRADRVEIHRKGQHVFSGNVSLTQGELSISADYLQVETRNGALAKISGSGTPLVVENKSPGLEPVRAQAETINYETSKWLLILIGSVKLQKKDWEMHGHRVEYNLRKQIFTLTRNESGPIRISFSAPYAQPIRR